MTAILTALLNFLLRHFTALKVLLYALLTLVLPVVIWNVYIEITEHALGFLYGAFSSVDTPSFSFSFASLGSLAVWMASQLRLAEAFAAFVSGIAIRLTADILMRVIIR